MTNTLANLAWLLGTAQSKRQPFTEQFSIHGATAGTCATDVANVDALSPGLQSLLGSLWSLQREDLSREIFESWAEREALPCVFELGLLLMDSAWRKDCKQEWRLLLAIMHGIPVRLMRVALWSVRGALPENIRPSSPPSLPQFDMFGLSEQECRRYLKLARFVEYLHFTGRGGSPESILEAVEWFPKDVGKWLKVAGGDKAVLVWDSLCDRLHKARLHEVIVEIGALVGYTCTRLGAVHMRLRGKSYPQQCCGVVSIELDSVHACVARHAVDLAGLSFAVEIWIGHFRDVMPRLGEDFGSGSLGFTFFDQKGTSFHDDLAQLEYLGLIPPGGRVAADNCLKPGAPAFVWRVTMSGLYAGTSYALAEFASEEIEDWLVVCDCALPPRRGGDEYDPPARHAAALQRVAWESDHMRGSAESGALHADDWIAFSQYVLRSFRRMGMEAVPWQPREDLMRRQGQPSDKPLDNDQLLLELQLAETTEEDADTFEPFEPE